MGCMRSTKCTYQISYQCNCSTVNKPKCNTTGAGIWGGDTSPLGIIFLESLNSHFCCISYLLSNTGTRNSNFHNHCFRIPGLMPFPRNFQARKSQQFNSMYFQGMYEPWNGHSIINYDFLTLMMVEGGHFKQRMKRRSRLDIRQHVLANRVVDR